MGAAREGHVYRSAEARVLVCALRENTDKASVEMVAVALSAAGGRGNRGVYQSGALGFRLPALCHAVTLYGKHSFRRRLPDGGCSLLSKQEPISGRRAYLQDARWCFFYQARHRCRWKHDPG